MNRLPNAGHRLIIRINYGSGSQLWIQEGKDWVKFRIEGQETARRWRSRNHLFRILGTQGEEEKHAVEEGTSIDLERRESHLKTPAMYFHGLVKFFFLLFFIIRRVEDESFNEDLERQCWKISWPSRLITASFGTSYSKHTSTYKCVENTGWASETKLRKEWRQEAGRRRMEWKG